MNNALKKIFSVVFSGLCLSFLSFPAYCSGKPKKIDEEKKPYRSWDVNDENSSIPSCAMKLSEIERNKYLINQRKYEDFMAQERETYKGKENYWVGANKFRLFHKSYMKELGDIFKRFIFESSSIGCWSLKKINDILKESTEKNNWVRQVFPLDFDAFKLVITNTKNGKEFIFYFKFGNILKARATKKYDFTEELNEYNKIISYISELDVVNGYIMDSLKIRKHLVESVAVPTGVHDIKCDSFSDFQGMKLVDVLGDIGSVGQDTFRGCLNLKKINFHGKIQSIDLRAFKDCYSLEEIYITDGLKFIGDHAFENCFKLKKITIPISTEVIYGNAFLHTPDDLKIVYGGVEYDKDTFLNSAFFAGGGYIYND